MEAVVVNFKGGAHTHYSNQMIVNVDGVEDREKAKSLLKKKVVWTSPAGKEIKGEIIKVHGNRGSLLVRFEKGLPGQALGKKLKVE